MTKKEIIIIVMFITVLVVGSVIGHINAEAKASEVTFWVNCEHTLEGGYQFEHDFEITKPMLETMVKLSWWEAEWLEDGYLELRFFADEDEVWRIRLHPYGSEIKEVKKIIRDFDTKCTIPEQ